MATIFSKIISGELPAYKVAENEDFLAFLDINPNVKGHTLCIPKKETNRLFDLTIDEYTALMQFSYHVSKAIERVVDCKRVGLSVIGLEVPHVHVHLIPLNEMKNAQFIHKENLTPEGF
jgi:histidine triad (HIT) family protein